MIEPRYLTHKDLQKYLCLGSTSTSKLIRAMQEDVMAGKLPPFKVYVMPGSGRCHYDRKVIDQYLRKEDYQ